jgi:hypothetical protein
LEVSQILALEKSEGICHARAGAKGPQEYIFAVSENFENEKRQAIPPTYHVSNLIRLKVVDLV